jgi:hypothetical protein
MENPQRGFAKGFRRLPICCTVVQFGLFDGRIADRMPEELKRGRGKSGARFEFYEFFAGGGMARAGRATGLERW